MMDPKTNELITEWRARGPVWWAESDYGWIGENGRPITLAAWQRAALQAWWQNRETCTVFGVSNVKKTGKTLLDAVLTAWRWLALPGLHLVAANDLDQAQSRVFGMVADMVRAHPYLFQNTRIGRTEIEFLPSGSKLQALAADYSGAAGANFISASFTEAWGIQYENSIRLWEELTPVPGRFYGLPCLRIVDSYAGFEGESKTWHTLVDRGLVGDRISTEWPIYQNGGLVLFHAIGEWARAHCFRGSIYEADGYYLDQKQSLRPNAFTRMHSNERTAGESGFVPPEMWEACYSADVRPYGTLPHDNRQIVLAADASTSRDLTSLVGCVYDRDLKVSDVVYVRVWRPVMDEARGKPTVDLGGIEGEIRRIHKAGNLAACYFDPFQLHSIAMNLRKEGVKMVELAQTTGRTEADQALYDGIISRSIRHYGDPTLSEHVKNAVAIESIRGFRLAKEKTSLKIDAAVALSMAYFGSRKHSPTRKVARSWSGDPSSNFIQMPVYWRGTMSDDPKK